MRRMAPLTINIRPGLLGRVREAAERRRVGVDEIVVEALEHEFGAAPEAGAGRERRQAAEALFEAMNNGGFDLDPAAVDRLNAPPSAA
jgi:hypothetical protein